MFHTIKEAIYDLKSGKPVIVVDDEERENEGDLVALGEKVTPDLINFMITEGKGLVCMPVTQQLANKLNLHMMEPNNTDPFGTAFTVSIDHQDTLTGISAVERAHTIKTVLAENAQASNFRRPGHIFPLIAKEGGVLAREGHTEATVDLAILSGASPVGVICEIIKQDGTMARIPDLKIMAKKFDLKMMTIKELIRFRKETETHVQREIETILPNEFGSFKIYGYSNQLDEKEHIALVLGNIHQTGPVLTRIHSECLTGDIFGSHRCDCGAQLSQALEKIKQKGAGVLIYMRQEGRGIGLINKLRAYHLQDRGMDTVEANEHLGFIPDEREYGLSAQILTDLEVDTIDLMTNNPEKINTMETYGIKVNQRISLETPLRKENEQYMHTKFEKMGHLLNL